MSEAFAEGMRKLAHSLSEQSPQEVRVAHGGPIGAYDYQVSMTPAVEGYAAISWTQLADSFIVSVSRRCEWQSQDFIAYDANESTYTESAFIWSSSIVRRIASHGAAFVRLRKKGPVLFRETRAIVGDEPIRGPHDVLESWLGWHLYDATPQSGRW